MKAWMYPIDHKVPFRENGEIKPINLIDNESLLKWLDKFCPPKEWIICLTGGEPGLYKEIDALVPALNKRGYFGVIQTNGSLPIPKSKNFRLCTAWHEGVSEMPPYYDEIIILKNLKDNWQEKEKYCISKRIPYKILPFNRQFEGIPPGSNNKINKFKGVTTILSMGQVMGCPQEIPIKGQDIFALSEPPVVSLQQDKCRYCGTMKGVEIFLSNKAMSKL